jgi:hypothetical protein
LGDVQEQNIEALLQERFPQDSIERVPKGEHSADIVHVVKTSGGVPCGTILWESKRTRFWNDNWLEKLRDDQRSMMASSACIVSSALPKSVDAFDFIDGVWVASPRCLIPVAVILRQAMLDVAAVRVEGHGQKTKMELLYQYLLSQRFRHRVEAVVEKFSDMHDDLDKERKTMTRLWLKREMQIQSVIESTAGMYGDLQGIVGKTLKEIDGLDVIEMNPESQLEERSIT